jgi:hypothetical protein
MNHRALRLLLPAVAIVIAPLSAHAAQIYIGDAAAQGTALTTTGNTKDTAQTVTYASVNTDGASATYTAPAATTIKLTEVNFYKSDSTGTLTPFVARYTGNLTAGSVSSGANYTVLAIGDATSFAGDSTSSVRNLQFTVNGANPTIMLNAGDVLIAGFVNSVAAGVVLYDNSQAAAGNAIDYIALSNTLPASLPNPLTGNGLTSLSRTQKFNVGFDVVSAPVPEPSMIGLGLVGLALASRRQRRQA